MPESGCAWQHFTCKFAGQVSTFFRSLPARWLIYKTFFEATHSAHGSELIRLTSCPSSHPLTDCHAHNSTTRPPAWAMASRQTRLRLAVCGLWLGICGPKWTGWEHRSFELLYIVKSFRLTNSPLIESSTWRCVN